MKFATKNRVWLSVIVVLTVTTLWLGRKAGSFLVTSDPPLKSDAIVVLMGSLSDKVLHVVDLYHNGISSKVLVARESTVSWEPLIERGITPLQGSDMFREYTSQLGVPADSILIIPYGTNSTLDEALCIAGYVKMHPSADTLTLVCSASHSRRAGMIFRKVFKKADLRVVVSVSPSPYSLFDGEKWWSDRDNIEVVVFEWIKLISFVWFEQWNI